MDSEKLKLAKEKTTEALVMLQNGDKATAEATFTEAQMLAAEANVADTEAAAPVQMMQTLPQDVVTLTREQYQLLEQRQQRLEMELQSAKVKELCDTALARGVPPAVVNSVMPVLMACQRDAQATIRLTADTQPVNLFGAVAAILEAVPGRLGEVTAPDVGTRPVALSKPPTTEEAEEFARKRRKELGIKSTMTEVEL